MTAEERSKAYQTKLMLASSLEVKKAELNGIKTEESGEFRLFVDNIQKRVIAESIGVHNFLIWKDLGDYGTYTHLSNIKADAEYHTEKQMAVKKVQGSFGVENILSANKNKKCEESPLKDWILSNDCILAEIRPLTQEEKAELGEFKQILTCQFFTCKLIFKIFLIRFDLSSETFQWSSKGVPIDFQCRLSAKLWIWSMAGGTST